MSLALYTPRPVFHVCVYVCLSEVSFGQNFSGYRIVHICPHIFPILPEVEFQVGGPDWCLWCFYVWVLGCMHLYESVSVNVSVCEWFSVYLKFCVYKPGTLLLFPKPELPELPLPPPLPAMLYGSSSGIGIRGRFLISSGRWTANVIPKIERKRKTNEREKLTLNQRICIDFIPCCLNNSSRRTDRSHWVSNVKADVGIIIIVTVYPYDWARCFFLVPNVFIHVSDCGWALLTSIAKATLKSPIILNTEDITCYLESDIVS